MCDWEDYWLSLLPKWVESVLLVGSGGQQWMWCGHEPFTKRLLAPWSLRGYLSLGTPHGICALLKHWTLCSSSECLENSEGTEEISRLGGEAHCLQQKNFKAAQRWCQSISLEQMRQRGLGFCVTWSGDHAPVLALQAASK